MNSPFHHPIGALPHSPLSRRDFLWQSGGGLGGIALASLLNSPASGALPPHRAKAKRVVQFFMAGAASHLDLFDFKPDLIKHHGKPSDFGEPVEAFQNGLGPWKAPVWEFKPYGQSGKQISEAVADLAPVVDDIAWIHNVVGKSGVHSQATLLQTTGFNRPGFPIVSNMVWVFNGDGCLQEGVSAEAASLAGHLALDNLIWVYDDNKITIDGTNDEGRTSAESAFATFMN